MTQKEAVLFHLRKHKRITSIEAIELYGATRLSAIIYALRKEGHAISSRNGEGYNRFGHRTNYAIYTLLSLSERGNAEK